MDGETRVWVEGDGDGGMRSFSPANLSDAKTAFAISVHKSQGSEYDSVVVVLPPYEARTLSKELLYTAITRARKRCVIVAPPKILGVCAVRRVRRTGGLRSKLLAALGDGDADYGRVSPPAS
jgi:exodeoxyribonuclease V alpha subunit